MNTKRLVVLAMSLMLLQTSAFARQPNKELSSISQRERSMGPAEVTGEEIRSDVSNFFDRLLHPSQWFEGESTEVKGEGTQE